MVLLQEPNSNHIHSSLVVRDSFFDHKAHSLRLCSQNFKDTVELVREKCESKNFSVISPKLITARLMQYH